MKKIISAILVITLLMNGSVCFVQGSENISDYVTEEMFSSEYSDPENNEANIQASSTASLTDTLSGILSMRALKALQMKVSMVFRMRALLT